jgi:diguanylate cyclase (GGDEF)-like protein
MQRFTEFAISSADLLEVEVLSRHSARAACTVPVSVQASVLVRCEDGAFDVLATSGAGVEQLCGAGFSPGQIPGLDVLQQRTLWNARGSDVGVLRPRGWDPAWILAAPLHEGEHLLGALYAFGGPGARPPDDETRRMVRLIGTRVAVTLRRAQLYAEVDQRSRQLSQLMEITTHIAQSLEFAKVGQRIVGGVTEVTDFAVATLTLREGQVCRRVAASGLTEPRLGLETPFDAWQRLLQPAYRRGQNCYLIPPEADADWADVPAIEVPAGPNAWTAEHGLTVTLNDGAGDLVGFLSVDEPRSGRLPSTSSIDALEMFARQVQVALVNARLYEQVKHASQRDSLTGLRNRAAFWEDVPGLLMQARPDRPLALAMVDADRFKAINDDHGHVVGDQVLVHLADRLQRSVRHTDRIYRIGGEEFTVVMPATTAVQGRMVMARAKDAVRRNRSDLPPLTFSAGIAQFPGHATTADDLFHAADEALLVAKRTGRDRVILTGETG